MGALILAPVVMLFLPDLILHQHRSSVTRYGIALWIALIVCVAGFLAARTRNGRSGRSWWVIAAVITPFNRGRIEYESTSALPSGGTIGEMRKTFRFRKP